MRAKTETELRCVRARRQVDQSVNRLLFIVWLRFRFHCLQCVARARVLHMVEFAPVHMRKEFLACACI